MRFLQLLGAEFSHADAAGGFAAEVMDYKLEVHCEGNIETAIPLEHKEALFELLSQDPRPSYQNDPERVYGLSFAGMEVKFKVCDTNLYIIDLQNK